MLTYKPLLILVGLYLAIQVDTSFAKEVYRAELSPEKSVVASVEEKKEDADVSLPGGQTSVMPIIRYSPQIELLEGKKRFVLHNSAFSNSAYISYNPGSLFQIFGIAEIGGQILLAFNEDNKSFILVAHKQEDGQYSVKLTPSPTKFYSDAKVSFSISENGIKIDASYGGKVTAGALTNTVLDKVLGTLKSAAP